MKKIMKKTSAFLMVACLVCTMLTVPVFGATSDFMDTFETLPETSSTNGWSFENANNDTAGTIAPATYIMDSSKKALEFITSGTGNKNLAAHRVFPGRTGNFVLDFEIAFETKGQVLFYVYQGSTQLFTIATSATNITGYGGDGNYNNSGKSVTYLSSYAANTAYHFQVAVNSDKQIFNVYVNGEPALTNIPLKNKITTGMTKVSILQPATSTAKWQLLNFGIQSPSGSPSVSSVSIDKTPYFGNTITADYTYNGNANDDFSSVKWMYSDSQNGTYKYIPGATEKSFTVTPYVAGKWIKAEVTPCNGLFAAGTPVCSEPVLDTTVKTFGIDENSKYTEQKATALYDFATETLTLTPSGTTAAAATVAATNVLGTVIFEASIKNKTKSVSSLIYVYQGTNYVFNITFDANNINLLYSTTAGENKYTSKALKSAYTADTWYDIKAVINTSTSTADFYVDDVLVIEGAGLRANLSTKGISSMTLTGTSASGGETYIKGLKLYSVSTPMSTASSAQIQDATVYTVNGTGRVQLVAELFDQFGDKMTDTGFNWELVQATDGVSISADGVLSVDGANVDSIAVKAVSKDNASIIAEKTISVLKAYEISNFTISANDDQPITTLDRNVTVTASADVLIRTGAKNVTLLLAFYDATGKYVCVDVESVQPEYNVSTPISADLTIEHNVETQSGYFKAFVIDSFNTLKPLTEAISTKQ